MFLFDARRVSEVRGGMRRVLFALILASGCMGSVDESGDVATESGEPLSTNGVLYFYATPAAPGSSGPLALRRANAKPGLFDPTYGLAVVPPLVRLAGDAQVTQNDLDTLLAAPYAGNETQVVALVGARDATTAPGGPAVDVVEIHWANQPIQVSAVQQRDTLYELMNGGVVRLVNEKDYPADSSLPIDPAGSVSTGDFFVGTVTVHCTNILFYHHCDVPTAAQVSATFTR